MNHDGPLGFEELMFEMQPDEMWIFKSTDGCHLVRITERVMPPLPAFEEVESRIRELMQTQQERALLGKLLEDREKNLRVERKPLN